MPEINTDSILAQSIIRAFQEQAGKIAVPTTFAGQNREIRCLLANDYTGVVVPILDYMVTCANTELSYVTPNQKLNELLSNWQSTINTSVGKDIPPGLNNVAKQYFKERWQRSSLIVLKVRWDNIEGWDIPTNMWLMDGSQIEAEAETDDLGTYKYYIIGKNADGKYRKEVTSSLKESVYIRKPYSTWYDVKTVPYMVRRGILYNAMFKRELLKKQSEMVGAVLPYLLMLKAGNDTLAKLNSLATQPELDAVKNQLKDIRNKYTMGVPNTGIGAFNYDVNVEHLMPEFSKMMNEAAVAPIDRNLLSSLGLIELEGFSNSRKEAILNPKVLVEEVTDGVKDWVDLQYDILTEMLERNKTKHPKWTTKEVRIISSPIKSFMTNDMRTMIRSWYDRGLISYKSALSTVTDFDFTVEVTRRMEEDAIGLSDLLYPRLILNQEATPDNENQLTNNVPEQKKTEAQGSEEVELALYKSINDLPPSVKNHLPKSGQRMFMRVVNQALKDGQSDAEAFRLAWGVIKKYFYKNRSGKWVKKSK